MSEDMYDHIPALEAALQAWTNYGSDPFYHEAMKRNVRLTMPLLAQALDRAAQEQGENMSDRRARVHGFKAYKRNNYRWHVFLSTKGRRNGILAFDTWDEAMTAANLLTSSASQGVTHGAE